MSSTAYIFLPDIPYINDAKSKEEIVSALNQKYPAGKFESSKIIISRKQSKHNAYAQTTEEHQQKLLEQKQIKIGGQTVLLKKCFPNHQIYINKIPDSISKQQISNYFGQFGKIVNIQLFAAQGSYQNPKQKTNINHCYLRFQKDQDAQKCLFAEERHSIKSKDDIRVVRAYKIGQNDQTDKKLFLKITPIVQFDINKVEKELYNHFKTFGQLRQKIKVQQLSNLSSKAIITFTNVEAGQKALQNNKLTNIQQYSLVLRSYASRQSYMAFIGSLKADTTQKDLKSALQIYGKVVNCSLNPSKKQGTINAVATFSDQQSFKLALSDYKNNAELLKLFAYKPYMDIHMNASLRNDYNNFKKKDKKPSDGNFMNMGGIGGGFGLPPRGNQFPPNMIGGNQPFGFNPQMGLGLNPNMMGSVPKVPPPPQNFRPY